jgi:hypothetical protein
VTAAARSARASLHLFPDPTDAGFRAWSDNLARVERAGGVRTPRPTAPGIVWKLLAANRRHIAVGTRVEPTIAAAQDVAREVLRAAGELVAVPLQEGRRAFTWRLDLDGMPLVISSRWYASARDRNEALALVTEALRLGADAVLAPPPFDMTTHRWAPDADRALWRPQVVAELELGELAGAGRPARAS